MQHARETNSKITRSYVSFVDKPNKTADDWLQCKRNDDGYGRLWRVHNDLYDLTDFVAKHPGGPSWLTMTQGHDVTEAFETHHLQMPKVLQVLRNYHVSAAEESRNIRLTFKEDGFYRTLKRRVVKQLDEMRPLYKPWKTNILIDGLLATTYLAAILCTYNALLIVPTALLVMWLVIGGHNFLHQRDNWRMYYFNIAFFSYQEWRVSHALSHHMYPNSMIDMEMWFFEPLLNWLPTETGKTLWNRYGSWAYSWLLYTVMFVRSFWWRTVGRLWAGRNVLELSDLIPFSLPMFMFLFGSSTISVWMVLGTWLAIVCLASFMFGLTALNGGHHHPEAFHDGDAAREDLDFGIFQLDTMIDKSGLNGGNRFRVLTQFGDHILHHLFPTVDHGELKALYPVLGETLAEFGLEARAIPWSHLIVGQHLQLARVEPSQRCADEEKRLAKRSRRQAGLLAI